MNTFKNKLRIRQQQNDKAFEAFAEAPAYRPRIKRSVEAVTKTVAKVKPKEGFSHTVHIILVMLLPLIVYAFTRMDFTGLAIAVVLLSKWRMFSVKARHWPANIRANAIDMLFGVSIVLFMAKATTASVQFTWVVIYVLWLLFVKPKSSVLWIAGQAILGQAAGLVALYTVYGDANASWLVLSTALICYFAARHFFTAFDETLGRTSAYVWAYFGASVTWLLSHWLIYYGVIAQPVLIISIVGYSLAGLYYLQHTDKLSKGVQRQFVVVLVAVLTFLIVFSDWGDKTI